MEQYKLVINTVHTRVVVASMPIDEMLINIWFLSSVSVVGYARYSTIIMVDFKQK